MEGVECVCMRERENVCIQKGWSVRAWERMCVYENGGLYVHGEREDEGVECAFMGRGRMCIWKGWSVSAWGEDVCIWKGWSVCAWEEDVCI